MKRGLILITITSIFVISLVSAGTLSNFLNDIEPDTVVLASIFMASFAILHFALLKTFKSNRQIGTIIALIISFLITYGVNRMNPDFGRIIYWFQEVGWETFIFIIGLVAIFIWIILEEIKKSK